MSIELLQRKLGYRFRDSVLLQQALTHRSHGGAHYERLEFLGDAALGLFIARQLYQQFPDASEHDLTLMRASLVKGTALSALAKELGLGDYLRLGPGEKRSGGHQRASILADTVEALIGAVLLDGGPAAAEQLVVHLFAARLAAASSAAAKDAKTRLQEQLQARGLQLPEYIIESQQGEAHELEFTVRCDLKALQLSARASAATRREAEKLAAQQLLTMLQANLEEGAAK